MKIFILALSIPTLFLAGEPLTPAGKAIEAAQAAIAKEPSKAGSYTALALALTRRARETADATYYDKASAAVEQSLKLNPGDFDALKLKAWVLLGQHEFARALELGKELRARTADDEMVYGILTDAHAELGNYEAAEDAAQWMLNIGRSSISGLTRAAYLRELFGDIEGALELMYQVLHRFDPAETEDRAWTLTHIAHLLTLTGNLEESAHLLELALDEMPDYHYALAGLAKVRSAQERHGDAVQLLGRRYEAAPHPENLFDLAVALRKAGKQAESETAFARFERAALSESAGWDNANRELITYYTDYADRAYAALEIARREIARRRDVTTLDAVAWALHRNGSTEEALRTIEKALAVGTVDSRILHHAGVIAHAAGKPSTARMYLERSLEVNPRSEVAADAKRLRQRLAAEPNDNE